MSWSFHMVRTQDGVRVARLEPTSNGSWARRLGEKSTGSQEFKIVEGDGGRAWESNRPNRRTMVLCWDDQPVYAGIMRGPEADLLHDTVSVRHADVWQILEERQASPRYLAWNNPNLDLRDTELRVENVTRRTLTKRAIQLGMRGIDADATSYQLPFILPADEDESWTRTFRTADWKSVSEWIKDLAELGGPMMVDFQPVWRSDGTFAWDLRVFHAMQSQALTLHATAKNSPVTHLRIKSNVEEYASEYHVIGAGQGADIISDYWSSSHLEDYQVPVVRAFKDSSLETFAEVREWRDALLERHTNSVINIDCKVSIGSEQGINPAELRLGQRVLIRAPNHPLVPDGEIETMLIGFSPDGPRGLSLELSPVDGYTGHQVSEPTMHFRNLQGRRFDSAVDGRIRRLERVSGVPIGGDSSAATASSQEVD